MSVEQYKDLTTELEALILKQQLGILDAKEREFLRHKLKDLLKLNGYDDAADLVITLNRTPEQTEYLISIINKVFPCLKSKTKKSSGTTD